MLIFYKDRDLTFFTSIHRRIPLHLSYTIQTLMKNFMFICATVLTVSACTSDVNVAEDLAVGIEQEVEKTEVHPNQLLTMEVEGMVCKMGCGGSIRKGLKATKGVSDVKFDFVEDRVSNIATISFDTNIISAEEMVKIVTELNDGQFKVGSISSEDLQAVSTVEEHNSGSTEDPVIEISTSRVKMPNLLDLFSGLFTH